MNAFEILGVPETLLLDEDFLNAAYRNVGKKNHPDQSEGGNQFNLLNEAMQILLSPSKRLKHWLELQKLAGNVRGVVDGDLLNWFGKIGHVLQQVDALLRRYELFQSLLGKAMLEVEIHDCRNNVEVMIGEVESLITEKCEVFLEIQLRNISPEKSWICVRDLTFLEKWRAQLRDRYSQLFV
jgi:DnaJ domain